jgi:hypothetical protein
MTNFFQYLDICADTMKRLRDPGIMPHGMAIVVDDVVFNHLLEIVNGQSGEVTAREVKGVFTVEVVNRGYMRIQIRDYRFSVTRYIAEENDESRSLLQNLWDQDRAGDFPKGKAY